ncbi:ATP-binding protein [Archangium sp.]|uniref:AAA family ATPase n=1 Tax=Archangium sp. TaxID=1872627 RepID=UPI00286D3F51|nr:ATP-binding protein [Archangium sp.]
MLKSITLQNFKSFGQRQTVYLEPITVLVGPNNSGKSSFLSVAKFIANCALMGFGKVEEQEGGVENIIHRPAVDGNEVFLGWETDTGNYEVTLAAKLDQLNVRQGGMKQADGIPIATEQEGTAPFTLLSTMAREKMAKGKRVDTDSIWVPLVLSRFIHLSLEVLREDSQFVPEPRLTGSGANLASVLALWRSAYPEKTNQLDGFLRQCLPELKFILAQPSPRHGLQRLWVEQSNGQRFDAQHISEGVLSFIALAMHIIDAGPGSLILIEEPERSIHPQRLYSLVEFMRRAVHEHQCQFILSTHSRVLLDNFRDEPEAIVLFRRSDTPDQSTLVRRLADLPELAENLSRSPPGEMLETGFFTRPFES